MIYYNENDILIRDMVESDPEIITHEEHLQGWTNQKVEKYTRRLKDVANGKCVALVAEYKGNVLDYTDMESAFEIIGNLAKNGDVCLLSPAAASYEAFKNFEEKGKKYNAEPFFTYNLNIFNYFIIFFPSTIK